MAFKKKYAAVLMTAALAVSLSACGAEESADSGSADSSPAVEEEASQSAEAGTQTGGNLFSIQTEEVYPADGGDLIDYVADEQDEDARPELTTQIENLDDYDTVFVGFPKLEQGFTRV